MPVVGITQLLQLGTHLMAAIAAALLVVNAALLLAAYQPAISLPESCRLLSPRYAGSYYDFLLLFLIAAAIPFLPRKLRQAPAAERRRVRLFLIALLCGFGPILAASLLLLIPSFSQWAAQPARRVWLDWVLYSPLLSIPFTTAYAVLVHQVLQVRLIARRALQYTLARSLAWTLAAIPAAALVLYLYQQRHHTLAEICSGWRAALLFTTASLGLLALRYRRRLLDAIDRRFFREQFDARQILPPLMTRIRDARSRREMADLVAHGIDRALHPRAVALLLSQARSGQFVDPHGRVRPLSVASPLAALLGDHSQPLDIDLGSGTDWLQRLGEEAAAWLLDGEFHLLVPVVAVDGTLAGLLALGEKRSGLPFLHEDRQLLSAISHSAALALEVMRLRQLPGRFSGGEAGAETTAANARGARECFSCGRLYMPQVETCPSCKRSLETSLVPFELPGKFRFERRLGTGGMGVVYLAVDLALHRPVAVKTMRRVSIEDSLRLRREARAAAAVLHPNLAPIYGVESWFGMPMLILEYLAGGNLDDILEVRTLPPLETLDLGIALAGALDRLHAADILHRDLKPSNIGYSRDGTPKLMDFGIARVQLDLRQDTPLLLAPTDDEEITMTWTGGPPATSATPQLVGTLHYLSPEAVRGEAPTPSLDLWGLNVVLYECLTAERLFRGPIRQVLEEIRDAQVPNVRAQAPQCPEPLAEYFQRALHRDIQRRPASGHQMQQQLVELRRLLGGS